MGRKHSNMEEVFRQLTRKGVIIAQDEKTSTIMVTKKPNQRLIDQKRKEFFKTFTAEELTVRGVESAEIQFREKYAKLFQVHQVPQTIVIMPAKSLDLSKADGLGNKSWGRIDYLCNHCSYVIYKR